MRRWNHLKYLGLFWLVLVVAVGCSSKKKDKTEEADHRDEPVQITAYSEKTEVLVELAEPVAGEKGTMLVYLTRLADWKPVNEGALKLVLTPAAGAPVEVTVPAPARPGVYQAEVTVGTAGEYTLSVLPQGAGFTDRIDVAGIHVLKKGESHKEHEHAERPGAGEGKKDAHDHREQEASHGSVKQETHRQEVKKDDHHDEEAGHPAEKGEHHAEKGEHHAEKGEHHEEKGEHHPEKGARHAEGEHEHEASAIVGSGGGSIVFLKEQQWSTDFRTDRPETRNLASYFTTMGELVPVANAEATVSAPLAGIVSGSKALPFVGKRVAKGEVVAVIEPPVHQEGGMGQLTAGWAEAKNRVTLAQKEYDRARRLYEAKIAPLKRVEEAELALASARAALQPLEKAMESVKGEGGSRIALRAPVSGTVVEVAAANGKGVQAGEPLLRIINTGTVWLKANIPAADAGKAALTSGASFTVTGLEGEFRPSRLVTVNDMLDPQTRTLSVLFEVPNPRGRLKVGMFANVSLRTGEARGALAVPKEALVEDEGRWFVFVQTAAQNFERREVKVGAQDQGYVQITGGLQDHERVVTRGTYYVKLAAGAGKSVDPHAGHGH